MPTYNPKIFVIEDDDDLRHAIISSLRIERYPVQDYSTPLAFLKNYDYDSGCIVTDIQMPNMNGLELQTELKRRGIDIPLVFISAHGNIQMAVEAIKKGAFDFIEKPFEQNVLMACITKAISHDYENFENRLYKQQIMKRYSTLTPREKEILSLLAQNNGTLTNQSISEMLSISKRTVQVHRSTVMAKMLAQTRSELVSFCQLIEKESPQDNNPT